MAALILGNQLAKFCDDALVFAFLGDISSLVRIDVQIEKHSCLHGPGFVTPIRITESACTHGSAIVPTTYCCRSDYRLRIIESRRQAHTIQAARWVVKICALKIVPASIALLIAMPIAIRVPRWLNPGGCRVHCCNERLGACAVGRFSSGRMIRGRGNFVLTTGVPDIGTGNRHPALQGGVNRSPAGSMTVPGRRHRTAIPRHAVA